MKKYKIRTKTAIIAIVSLFTAVQQANAQWLYQEHGSAFDTKKTHIALTAQGRYAFGLRCSNANDLAAILITPERAERDSVATLNTLKPELIVRTDENDIVSIPAQGELNDGKLSMLGDSNAQIFYDVKDAKTSVSVATRMVGQIFHETRFSASGSTSAVSKLIALCGIDAP